jgi:hypothetical protein
LDFLPLKVGDFAYFERLTVSTKILGVKMPFSAGVTSFRAENVKTKYI